jgi:hypothetical protein
MPHERGNVEERDFISQGKRGPFSQSDCRYYSDIMAAASLVAENFKIANFYRKL